MPRYSNLLLLIAASIIAIFFTIAPSTAHAQEEDSEIWIGAAASGRISGPLLGSFEATLRIDDANTNRPTRVLRPMLGYRVSKPVSVWIGYTRVEQFPIGRPHANENRLFQQLNWDIGKLGAVCLSSRTRLEQRFFENGGGSAWRLREHIKLAIPLRGTNVSIVAATEPFVALQTSVPGAHRGVEQWHNSLGVTVPLSNSTSLEAGYLNRTIFRRNAPDRMDHIFPLTLAYRF